MFTGSTGIIGADDNLLALIKDNRMSNSATLQISGRDEGDKKLLLSFEPKKFTWELVSDDEDKYSRQMEFENDPIIIAITEFINKNNEWSGTATTLLKALQPYSSELPTQANQLTRKLNSYKDELLECNIIVTSTTGSGMRTLSISKIIKK